MTAERSGEEEGSPAGGAAGPGSVPTGTEHELTVDSADELVGLARRHAQGELSDEEFLEQRRRLLG